MAIDKELLRALTAPLPKDAVKTRAQGGQALSYVEGWYAIDQANKVFGFDGWSMELVETRVVHQYTRKAARGENLVALIQATVRIRALGVVREDVGVGVCDASAENPVQGWEKAIKEAATDATKRALRTFGYRFGLALYDKTQEHVGGTAEMLRLSAELGALSWRELKQWAKKNAEAVKSLPADERAAFKAAYEARLAARPSALEMLAHDLLAVETREQLHTVWREHQAGVQALCGEGDDAPLAAAREQCWQCASTVIKPPVATKKELNAILDGSAFKAANEAA